MKNVRECGPTGKLRFTAEEITKEIARVRKARATSFQCRVCRSFHLVIRRNRNDSKPSITESS